MKPDANGNRQLDSWQGEFGDAYTDRNRPSKETISAQTRMWARILESLIADPPGRILEVGANVGVNLRALSRLTSAELYALEPNDTARWLLIDDKVIPKQNVTAGIAADIDLPDCAVDMVFTCGVLIHIAPNDLLTSCREIHRVARRYIVCIEYFDVAPQEIRYRGHDGLLFKRDFGAFWLENFSDLETLDYGFFWKPATGLDNLTWWLFEKC